MTKSPLIVAGVIFAIISVLHLVRLFYDIPVMIGTTNIPLWTSGVAAVAGALLTYWMFASACCRSCKH